MSEIKLIPCPFCGGDCIYETFEIDSFGAEIPVIFCNHCKIVFKVENDSPYLNDDKTYDYLAKKNIEIWNTRKPMERIVERLEEELYLADKEKERSAKENPLQLDSAKGYANGVAVAIEIVKEEGGEFVLNGSKANNDVG